MSVAERKALAAQRKAAREAARADKQAAARIERARRRLVRARAMGGVGPRLAAGMSAEDVARELAEIGDKALAWDAWLDGSIGTPIAAVLEVFDGPTIYAAALLIAKAAEAKMRARV